MNQKIEELTEAFKKKQLFELGLVSPMIHKELEYNANEFAKECVALVVKQGWRPLSDNQELPKYNAGRAVDTWIAVERILYQTSQQDMLKANFKRIEEE